MNSQKAQDLINSPTLLREAEHDVGIRAAGMLLSQSQVIRHVRHASNRASRNKH